MVLRSVIGEAKKVGVANCFFSGKRSVKHDCFT